MMNQRIVISKTGSDHIFEDKNNQDFVISAFNLKMVLDGCGSCPFSEIGTRLFAQFFMEELQKISSFQITEADFFMIVNEVFEKLTKINPSDEFFYNNFCFTILACLEFEEEFLVLACGDGYLLVQDKVQDSLPNIAQTNTQNKVQDSLTDIAQTNTHNKVQDNAQNKAQAETEVKAILLEDGEYPRYYIYNYVQDKERLQEYQEGVDFTRYSFSKKEYQNVGVATDGFRFFEKLGVVEKNKLFSYFREGKKGKIGMLINRNANVFKDDISICF